MKINHTIAAGLTVGVLAGGAGGAIAATTPGSRIAGTSSTTTSRATDGWDGHGYGWGRDTSNGGMRWASLARAGRRAALTYLGLSASQLGPRVQSGTTLAEIASSQGKSAAGLERAIEPAVTDSVHADSGLNAGQKSSIIANLPNVVDSVVTGTWHGGPVGPMMGAGW